MAIGHTIMVSIGHTIMMSIGNTLLVSTDAAVHSWILSVITETETETSWVDVAVSEDQEGTEDRLRKEIENAVEYSLGIW